MLATVGEQSDKPIVSTFLASEGVPELLRVPDLAGVGGPRLGAVVPRPRVGRPGAGPRRALRALGQPAARDGAVLRRHRHRRAPGCW